MMWHACCYLSELILRMYDKWHCVLGVLYCSLYMQRAPSLTFCLGAHQMQCAYSPRSTGCLFMNPSVIICQHTSDIQGDDLYGDAAFSQRQSARPWDGDGGRQSSSLSPQPFFKWAFIVLLRTNRCNHWRKQGAKHESWHRRARSHLLFVHTDADWISEYSVLHIWGWLCLSRSEPTSRWCHYMPAERVGINSSLQPPYSIIHIYKGFSSFLPHHKVIEHTKTLQCRTWLRTNIIIRFEMKN